MDETDEPVAGPVLEGQIERNARGRFVKGNPGPPEHAKRKKGVPNKVNRTIKDAMTGAAARIGYDGKGRGGVDGFLERVGRDDPSFLAAALIRATVPVAKDPDPSENSVVVTINILPVAHACYLTADSRIVDGDEAELCFMERHPPLIEGRVEPEPESAPESAPPPTPTVKRIEPEDRSRIGAEFIPLKRRRDRDFYP